MLRKLLTHNQLFFGAMTALALVLAASCASVGTPGGGWYDETPPVLKKSTPAMGAVNVKSNKIHIQFDENVKLVNANEKLVVSPPQRKAPLILSNAKTVTVELMDTLIPNTTYTLDFGDAIADNNEGNTLEQFALTFSTGSHIDSLKISGMLLNAEDLEPVTGAFVGIYPDTVSVGDSAIYTLPMFRAGKTDALGRFMISGVAPGAYRVYALKDENSNFYYDLNTESVAFLDSLVVPSLRDGIAYDTVWTLTHKVDTVKERGDVVYLPNDLQLRLFNEGKSILYMDNYERPDSSRLTFRFSGKMPELPQLEVLDVPELRDSAGVSHSFIVERNPSLDTLTYWIADTLLQALDTLKVAVNYYYTDTLKQDVLKTDTINFTRPVVRNNGKDDEDDKPSKGRSRGKKKRGKEAVADSVPVIRFATWALSGSNSIDLGKKPMFEAGLPIASIDTSKMHLEEQVDTLWNNVVFRLEQDSMKVRKYQLFAMPHLNPGKNYRFVLDSAAVYDIYGAPNAPTTLTFKTKTPEDYAHLMFRLQGVTEPAFVQLLTEKDAPVQQATVVNGVAKFVNVPAGKYSARLVIDTNQNNRFDPGNLLQHKQPEEVFYLNMILELRANWQFSQDWNPRAVELSKQKPEELKKNKPKEKQQKESKNAEYYRKMGIDPETKQKIKN